MLNSAVAEGMSVLSGKVESGMDLRDAVAEMFKENWPTVFNGNGYSEEWNGPGGEAEKRGLLNLRTSVEAYALLCSEKNEKLFSSMGVFKPKELQARQNVLYENYVQHILIEVNTMIDMMKQGVIPACARDLQGYTGTPLAGKREQLYSLLAMQTDTLADLAGNLPHGSIVDEAEYCCNVILPAMNDLRATCDEAEGECAASLWPYPSYTQLTLSHHSEPPLV